MNKLNKILTYICNNKAGIINYEHRKKVRACFPSNIAESTVNTLINEGQKGKQKMLWSGNGVHNILQIRSTIRRASWENNWKKVENKIGDDS